MSYENHAKFSENTAVRFDNSTGYCSRLFPEHIASNEYVSQQDGYTMQAKLGVSYIFQGYSGDAQDDQVFKGKYFP